MAKPLKAGDKVAWDSSGGGSVGRVERKLTSPVKIKGHERLPRTIQNFSSARRSPARSRLISPAR
jgi:hypothetical protein